MDNTFSFRTVATQQAADEITQLLSEKNIKSEVIKESFNPASTFSEGTLSSNYEIRIDEKDRAAAEGIMKEEAKSFLADVDPEHYLFSFTDEELLEVLAHNFDWSEIDVLLSEKILNDRGAEIDLKKVKAKTDKRMQELAVPKRSNPLWIILGYLLAFGGGLLGMAISFAVMIAKRKLPDGTTVYDYDSFTRKHATIIFVISSTVIGTLILMQLSIIPFLW